MNINRTVEVSEAHSYQEATASFASRRSIVARVHITFEREGQRFINNVGKEVEITELAIMYVWDGASWVHHHSDATGRIVTKTGALHTYLADLGGTGVMVSQWVADLQRQMVPTLVLEQADNASAFHGWVE